MESALFTYGTLMPRDPASCGGALWEPDAVQGRLYDLGPYPGLVDLDDSAAGWVEGYIRREISSEMFRQLDAYEGALYERVRTTSRKQNEVWVYVYVAPLPRDARGPLTRWVGTVGAWPCSAYDSDQGDS
jgi:gamma-glutamylcyclotransferase (GGCT)/AIG2-like uncharacterized protein YtfP